MRKIVELEREIGTYASESDDAARWKRNGFSDKQIATLTKRSEADVREERHALGVRPVYKRVDTCAAEFEAIDAVPLLDLRDTKTKRSRPRAAR